MTKLIDQHIHCCCSLDSTTPMADMVEAARDPGMAAVCFTDHVEMDDSVTGHLAPNFEQWLPEMLSTYEALMASPPEGIQVRLGMELGAPNHFPEGARAAAARTEFDFILGSLHNLRDVTDFYYYRYTTEAQCRRINEDYLTELLEIARMDCFDVMAHVAYTCRYMARAGFQTRITAENSRDELTELFRRLISGGKGIEVNTSGLRRGGQAYPSMDILRLYRELGGEIVTVGSDGHVPRDAGALIPEGYELLRAAGFRYVAEFVRRQPVFHAL